MFKKKLTFQLGIQFDNYSPCNICILSVDTNGSRYPNTYQTREIHYIIFCFPANILIFTAVIVVKLLILHRFRTIYYARSVRKVLSNKIQ